MWHRQGVVYGLDYHASLVRVMILRSVVAGGGLVDVGVGLSTRLGARQRRRATVNAAGASTAQSLATSLSTMARGPWAGQCGILHVGTRPG